MVIDPLAYNLRGQRLLVALGNGVMTRYGYDPTTFRLRRQRTEGFEQPDALTYEPRGHHLPGHALRLRSGGQHRRPDRAGAGQRSLNCSSGFTHFYIQAL